MSRGVIIVLLTAGISGQLFRIWVARSSASQLTTLQRVALWTKQLSILLVLLCVGLSLAGTSMRAPLDIILTASLGIGVVSTLACWGLRTAMPRKGISESTWSPFQSTEVRAICTHLNPTEHARLIDGAMERGRQIGLWFAVPLTGVIGFLFWSWRLGLMLVALFVVYFVLWVLPRFRAMRYRSIEMLCETEWARTQNYVPTRLRLMTLPWSK
jgi:hypothetical protein